MAKEENNILNRWLLKNHSWGRLFRNNQGSAWAGEIVNQATRSVDKYMTLKNPYRIGFGLLKGSADYIGWTTITITPEMVGRRVAVFASVEGKSKNGQLEDDQKIWLLNVRRAGGIAFVVRDPETKPSGWEDFSE